MSTTQATTHKVVQITGNSDGYDVIEYTDVPTPKITAPTEVLVKNKYAGINFIEGYFRRGYYPVSQFPYVLGREAAGTVIAVGSEVKKYKVGDNVAYIEPLTFAQYTKFDESKVQVAKLRSNLSDDEWNHYGSVLLQGLTALSLVEELYPVQLGDHVLVWAAAGGVGQIVVQLAHLKGAKVIAIALTKEKLELAKKLGADHLVLASDDIKAKVDEITGGQGVAASFDSVGKDSFETSLATVARKGTLVSYGNALGVVPPFSIGRLAQKNLKLLRPTLHNYIATQEEWDHYLGKLIDLIDSGKLSVAKATVYELGDYKQAVQDLEGRKTTGKLTLKIPQ